MQAVKKQIGDIGGVQLGGDLERRRDHASFPGEIGRCTSKGKYGMIADRQRSSGCGKDFTRTSAREGCLAKPAPADTKSVYGGKVTASVFNPAVAQAIVACYAPKEGVCFDPFGGGGTRAIIAAKNGLQYKGVELRQEEVMAVGQRCAHCGVTDSVVIHCGDSRDCSGFMPDSSADFCYTCPPYHDLEKYEGGPADLSMCSSYAEFVKELSLVVAECSRILKPGSNSCWVVGLHRDKAGELLAMNHDVARIHQANGFRFKEEVVLAHKNNGAIQRVGNFEKGDKRLIRMHEYVLVFVKK